jgi:hypothetical protein
MKGRGWKKDEGRERKGAGERKKKKKRCGGCADIRSRPGTKGAQK